MTRVIAIALLLAIAGTTAGCVTTDVGRVLVLCSFNPHDCN
jgi:hypothetical protein